MRSISFGLAVGLVLGSVAACGGDEVKPPATPDTVATTTPPPAPAAEPVKEEPKAQPSLADLEKKAGMGLGEALNAHDAKKVASFYTENAVVKVPGMPDVVGRDGIAADWQKRFDIASNAKSAPSRIFMKGDVVVVEWAFAGTHSGDMMGVKATEKPIGATGADVMWFTPEGLIKEQHTYTDAGTIMSQIGVSKQKARGVPTLAGKPEVFTSTGSAEETKNVDVASKMWAAFEKKNEADFLGATTDDISWDDMTQPETMKGKAAGKKYFAEMTKAFPDLKTTTANSWGVGDFVIAEGTFTGTHKGALFGMQPTKKQVNMHGLDILQFNKDGKIVKGTSYGNGAEMMMQLGLMPAAGAKAAPKADAKDAKPATPAPAKDAKPATPIKDAKPATPAPAKK